MKPVLFSYAVAFSAGTLGVWGLLTSLQGPDLLSVAMLVTGFAPLLSATYEVFGRDTRSEFVFYDGEGWYILTCLCAAALSILVLFVLLSPTVGNSAVSLNVATVFSLTALGYYAYYLGYRLTTASEPEAEGKDIEQSGSLAALLEDEE